MNSSHSLRRTYGYGYKTRNRAEEVLDDMLAHAEVSLSEKPMVEPYQTTSGNRRFRITIEAG